MHAIVGRRPHGSQELRGQAYNMLVGTIQDQASLKTSYEYHSHLMNESDFKERQVQLQGRPKIWPRTARMQTVGVQATRTPSGTIRIRKETATVHSVG